MEWVKLILSWIAAGFRGFLDFFKPLDIKLVERWENELRKNDERWHQEIAQIELRWEERLQACENKHNESEQALELLKARMGLAETERSKLSAEVQALQQIVIDLGGTKIQGQIIVGLLSKNIVDLDYKAAAIIGWRKASIIGKPLAILVPAEYRRKHDEGIERVANGGEIRTAKLDTFVRSEFGHHIPITITLSEPFNDNVLSEPCMGGNVNRR